MQERIAKLQLPAALAPTVPFVVPLALGFAVLVVAEDPTFRFPLLVFLLPVFLRAASVALGYYDESVSRSKTGWTIHLIGFTAFMVGWTIILAILTTTVTVALFSLELTATVMKRAIIGGCTGFVVAAWFWWPSYARPVLPTWPRRDQRIWVPTHNRWEALFRSFRMQQLATSGGTRWLGFAGVALVVALVVGVASLGVYRGALPRVLEVVGIAVLPVCHLVVVHSAARLCDVWRRQAPVES